MSKNVPEIRINGFEDSWKQYKVSEITEFHKQGFYTTEPYDNSKKYYLLRGTDLTENKLLIRDTPKIDATEKDYQAFKTQIGDFLIVRSGTVGTYGIVYEDIPAIFGSYLIDFRFDKLLVENEFFGYFYQSDLFRNQLRQIIQQSANTNINAENIKSIFINLPSLPEQEKIGTFITKLDNIITLHQQEYDKLVNNKKAMLEKMFPKEGCDVPEIRFKGFDEPWKKCELADFGKATGGTSIESEFSEEGIFKVISIGSYSEDNIYREQGLRAIESEKTKIRILNKGDITMILNDKTASGNIIGRVLLIDEDNTYVYNQRTERIEITNEDYDSLFIYQMLNAPKIREKIIKQSQGNTQIYVNWTTISKTEYWVPCIEEQQKIGEYFAKFDELIMNHQQELEKLKNIKAALLEKMFV